MQLQQQEILPSASALSMHFASVALAALEAELQAFPAGKRFGPNTAACLDTFHERTGHRDSSG